MTDLDLDYETFSRVDIKGAGAYKYARDPSTEILMLSWAFDDDDVKLWQPHIESIPPELKDGITDPHVTKYAYNAQFERLITRHVLGVEVPPENWRCMQVASSYLGFTGRLGDRLKAIGLAEKDPRGDKLINIFSKPAPKNHKADRYTWDDRPDEWQEFCEYCIQDTFVERELKRWMMQFPVMHKWDWDQWFIDQRINDRGVPMDVEMALSAVEVWRLETEQLKSKMAEITGLPKVTRGPFLQYLYDAFGVTLENTQKDYLNYQLKLGAIPEEAKPIINLWQQKEAKAVSKYTAVLKAACEDNRARGMFQYKGAARTDRVGGRVVQLQNLKRPFIKGKPVDDVLPQDHINALTNAIKMEEPEALSMLYGMPVSNIVGGAIRHVIKAETGKTLVIADLSSIESVVLGWLAMCPLIDETFRSGKDTYKVFASRHYKIGYDEVTKDMRNFAKPPVLGCGYMLGWKGLIAYAEGYGVKMSEGEARSAVDTFRTMYPEIPAFWDWIGKAVHYVTETWQPLEGYRLVIERDADFLRIRLPSGRNLSYYQPEMEWHPAPWNSDQLIQNFSYMGTDDKNRWVRIRAHSGLLTENIVQSIAGDILWNGIVNAEAAGLNVILHVHDEVGCEEEKAKAKQALKLLIDCMTRTLSWAPDMWLGAAGFITDAYTKD